MTTHFLSKLTSRLPRSSKSRCSQQRDHSLAARHRLPAVYPFRFSVANGGLISYGPDIIDQHRRTASYVDRTLRRCQPGQPADRM